MCGLTRPKAVNPESDHRQPRSSGAWGSSCRAGHLLRAFLIRIYENGRPWTRMVYLQVEVRHDAAR
jgi:hypothetical protein